MINFQNVRLLGLIENNEATDEEKLLFRILNPLGKLYNAKVAIPAISESLECIGGQGIMEDTGIPYLYRDAQIFAIWEGTTSVLSMDVLRSIIKTNGETIFAFRFAATSKFNLLKRFLILFFLNRSNIKRRLGPVLKHDRLKDTASKVLALMDEMLKIGQSQPALLESGARDFSFSLSNIFVASMFLQNAIAPNTYSNAELLALR